MDGVQITVVPMGVTTIKSPNKAFSVAMQAQADAKKYIQSQRKNLPLPRGRKLDH